MNKTILVGHLGADPELRHTSGGAPVCNFRMATNESYTDKEGKKVSAVEWHRIVVWGKLGEACSKFLTKGRQVLVEGRIRTRQWEDKKANVTRYSTEIEARTVEFLGSKGEQKAQEAPVASLEDRQLSLELSEPELSAEAQELFASNG